MNDLRLLTEEQSARNNLLEKKQRKFDSETQMLQDELKKEKQARERLSREKEVMLAEKYALESSLAVSLRTFICGVSQGLFLGSLLFQTIPN